MSNAAQGQPMGGSVVAGQAQISSAGATTLINQSSSKAIINWQSFSVGQSGAVQFNQPNSSAITLNRVTGGGASIIDGAIRANGQVWLLNPNGLLFGNGAAINVGGLLATTSDIADQDFLAGRYNFSSTGGKGGVTNAGAIKTGRSGSVVLSAPNVVNTGLIQADAGHVVLGGTDTFTVDFQGDHLLSYAVGTNSTGGKVANSGTIAATGGKILMTAHAAAGVQDAVINNTGMVEATSVREENGEIILEADNGTVANSGTLDASGKASGETGGTVKVLGQQVAVADGAKIDVTGDAGGGTALIGGNLHGAGPEPDAQNTTVGKATINASAVTSGDGGRVVVYSTGTTQVAATITAKGGAISGKGGIVETSGHTLGVATSASVNTAARHGTPGDWLLDPNNLNIVTSGTGTANGETFATSTNDTIDPNTIVTALNSGNVTLQANNTITVSNAVSATSTNTLELDAGGSITLSAGLQVAGGSLKLYAGDPGASSGSLAGAAITQGTSGTSIVATNLIVQNGTVGGTITLNDAGNSFSNLTVTTNGGDASISNTGSISINSANLTTGGNFTLSAGGAITQIGAIVSNALNITTTNSPVTLVAAGNNFSLLSVSTSGGAASIATSGSVAIANPGVNTGTGDFTLSAGGAITQSWGITANNLSVTSTVGGATLADAGSFTNGDNGNVIAGTARFNTASDVSYTNADFNTSNTVIGTSTIGGNLTVRASSTNLQLADTSGSVQVTGAVNLTANGSITQTIPLNATGLTLSASGVTLTNTSNAISGIVTFQIPLDGGQGAFLNTTQAMTLGISNVGNGGMSVTAGGALTLAGNVSANGSSGANVSLSGSSISQTSGALSVSGVDSFAATATGSTGGIALTTAGNAISPIINMQAPGAISLTNSLATTIGTIGNGATGANNSIPLAASSVTLQILGAGNALTQGVGLGIAAHTISLSSADGLIGNLYASSPIVLSGGPDASNTPDAATLALSVSSGGGNVFISSHSPVSIANGGVNLNSSSPFGGNFILSSYGSVAVNAPITTTGNIIGIDTGGSIQVNAPITALQNGSGPGAIVLNANDANLNFFESFSSNSNSNGITGSGLLTAGIINLNASYGQNGLSGSIGTQTQPLQLTSDTGSLSLAALSANGNVYLNSAVGVSIDDETSEIASFGVVLGSGTAAMGINTKGTNNLYGEVSLTAAGAINQTYGIQSGILALTATGPNGNISLTDTGSGSSGDPGNAVYGTISLNSTGFAYFYGPTGGTTAINLGASNVGGGLFIYGTSSASSISVADPAGGSVQASGITLYSAGNIRISSPLISTSYLLLSAGSGIQQSTTGDTHIQATSLQADTTSGSISLGGSGNQITGGVSLSAPAGDITFANVPSTMLGLTVSSSDPSNSSGNVTAGITAGGTFTAITPGDITLTSGATILAGASGTAVILRAGGNFINNSGLGQSALVLTNGGSFNIYSRGPAGDTFGGLNSGNTAVWNTSYTAPVTVTGNRYIFAFQPTIAVSVGNQSKTYGTDDTAALQSLASTPSGVQSGVTGAFLGDTAASVYSGVPVVSSAGAAAGANVGSYSITASLTVTDGYALAVTPGTLTVTPATLFYNANSVSRFFGTPNPVLSGTVTGFVNGDTQASATKGTLVFSTTATSNSPIGSYAIDGSGLTAANYMFVQASGNATALTITQQPVQPTILASFTNSLQLPPLQSLANTPLGAFNLASLPVATPPPPPPPPPAPPLILASDNAEQPNSSDQTTDEVANSLDGGGAGSQHGGSVVIPQMLVNGTPPPPPPTDISSLSSFGNSSLWQ
ncbi:MAG TPA: filamentous hemagglutinin N-terminal domain-containing protein [Rhizomicrobium sp.]|nr:filamentous hemagglutinin N-terminal domain-containing protein [Rhizomicrobium sp.]